MTHERIENLLPADFKRLTGVYPDTFALMVKVVSAEKAFHKKMGRPSKLSVEEQILTLFRHSREWEDRNDREKRILTENLSIDRVG